ncbi:MAG: ABC transporter ATP-binding protein [Candidatus Coatesbacteria bacterium]|nr:ABC transporter ATP-binding protein [Candidatus Coatesbacteria bacterium]
MIRFENVKKTFHKAKTLKETVLHPFRRREKVEALLGITGHIEKGKLYSLLGPNGAGKTTLLKIVSTLILPDFGEVFVNNFSIYKDGAAIRAAIGLVQSDERSFYWRLTGRQNLEFYGSLQGINRRQLGERINRNLEMLGMLEAADRQFQTYSTGMRQKLAIARGLLHEPEIIIMDEPTRSLDPLVSSQIRQFMTEDLIKKQGKTVILATHNLYEAEELSDKVAIINKGKLIAEGSVKELSSRLGGRIELTFKFKKELDSNDIERLPENTSYQKDPPLLKWFAGSEEEIIPILKDITKWLPECEMEKKTLSLEEIFSGLVKEKKNVE